MINYKKIASVNPKGVETIDDFIIPRREMKGFPNIGEEVLVIELPDQKASMKIYNHLYDTENYKTGDHVEGIVYELKPEMGAFVAVDDTFHALIPRHELYREITVGARIQARITKVEQGKIWLSIREKAAIQIDEDMQTVIQALNNGDGLLFLNDHSSPDVIRKKLNMSKRAYKRAVGRLLSEGIIDLFEEGIQLNQS